MTEPNHPLRITNFRAYLASRLSMTLAQYAMLLVIGWQTYNIARDSGLGVAAASGQLALIGLLQFLPLFVISPFAGLAADRLDRRAIARSMIALQLVGASVLLWFTWQDAMTLPVLYAVAMLIGIARGFVGPAMSALSPNLVPKTLLPQAIALSSIAWQTGMIVGPGLGGYFYAKIGRAHV